MKTATTNKRNTMTGVRMLAAVAVTLLSFSCSEEIAENSHAENNTEYLSVVVNEPVTTTRAVYNDYATTFETGDAIGIYAFNGTAFVENNVRFVKQSDGSWTGDKKVTYNSSYTYYAYYPYKEGVYSPSTATGDETVKLASFITDANNYFWKADQSTKSAFTSSNLCMATGVVTTQPTVVFNMKHQRGLAVIIGTERNSISYGTNKPCTIGQKRVFLLKPGVATTVGGYSFIAPAGMAEVKDSSKDYLAFTALETGTFTLTIPAGVTTDYLTSVSYSTDNGGTWVTTNNSSSKITITTPTIQAGEKVLWKGEGKASARNANVNSCFSSTGRFKASGNIMSLLFGSNFENQTSLNGKDYAFSGLFKDCTNLTSIPSDFLPATTLANYCYWAMFSGCTGLTKAPALPATTLTEDCYGQMFNGCTGLKTSPELPATTLANSCYYMMFYGCTGLTIAPELPATTLTESCYYFMFYDCTNLTAAPALPATTLAKNCYFFMFRNCTQMKSVPTSLPATTLAFECYNGMFEGCTSLTTVPSDLLPATALTDNCYQGMFSGCTSLTTAPALPATALANGCYSYMFSGCTSLTAAPALPATTLTTSCYIEMFKNCVKLTRAPELPATILTNGCYRQMFYGCTKLNYIKAAFKTDPSELYTENWVNGVSATGTFYKNSTATWNITGVNGIPSGWTVQTYTP